MGRLVLWRHIWSYSVCPCPINRTPGFIEITNESPSLNKVITYLLTYLLNTVIYAFSNIKEKLEAISHAFVSVALNATSFANVVAFNDKQIFNIFYLFYCRE